MSLVVGSTNLRLDMSRNLFRDSNKLYTFEDDNR